MTGRTDAVLGFSLMILSGAVIMAAVSGVALGAYLLGVAQALVAAVIMSRGSDFD